MLALVHVGPKDDSERTKVQRIINQTMWFIGTLRNSIVIIVTTFIGFIYVNSTGHDVNSNEMPPIPFKVVGKYKNRRYCESLLTLVFYPDCLIICSR